MRKFLNALLIFVLTVTAVTGLFSTSASAETEQEYPQEYQFVLPVGSSSRYLYEEYIYYHHKTVESYVIKPALPDYQSDYTCGITAGGLIASWYNKDLPGLIPGHTAGKYILNSWVWSKKSAAVDAMFTELNALMYGSPAGVTITNYKNGLSAYAAGKGYTFTPTKVYSNGAPTPEYRTALRSDKLLSVFVNGFNLCLSIVQNEGHEVATMELFYEAHVMAVYGYYDVTYYINADNILRKDCYLVVHSGLIGLSMVRINNAFIQVDDCYISQFS